MIINFDELKNLREKYANKKIVLAIGTFDLFHYEHLRYLEDAKKLGDILVVVVKDKAIVQAKSKDRPIIDDNQRVEIVDALRCVDYTILTNKKSYSATLPFEINELCFESTSWLSAFYKIFQLLRPNILYHENTKNLQPARECISEIFGTKLIERERTAIVSTTKIINKINNLKNN